MSPRSETLQGRMAAAVLLVRRSALLALALGGGAVLAAVLFGAWLLGVAWPRPTVLALLIDLVLVAGGIAAAGYWRATLRRRLGRAAVAAAAERRLGLPGGSLRGVLELDEHVPAGTSAALARRAERVLHEQTRGHSMRELTGDLGERWYGRARGGTVVVTAAALALVGLAFRAPERTAAGWGPLLHPVRQMSPAPLPALAVEPGEAHVARGEPLAVRIRAEGREAVTLKWRLQGDVVHEQLLVVRGDSALGATGAVVAPGSYWVEAPDGAVSPQYAVTPVDGLLLADLGVDVVYPRYLTRPPDHYDGEIPPLEIPAGTTLRINGQATRPLGAAALQGSRGLVALAVASRGFSGSWQPTESGLYGWVLTDSAGAGPAVLPPPLEISVTGDRAPTVELTFPGVDTVLPADLRQPLAADAQDDHAIASATLVSWRARAGGGQDPAVRTPLPLGEHGDRVVLNTVLDASARSLAPGDTLKYFLQVSDDSPAGQSGVSATYALRLPTGDELRALARAQARAALKRTESLEERAAELQRQTRNTDRNTQAANARRGRRGEAGGEVGGEDTGLRFDETEDARRVVAEQQQVLADVEQLRGGLADMRQSMAAAGLRDEELQRRMEEVERLLDRLATPELRRELAALQQALQQMDPAELQQVLDRLAREQQEMKEQLDRTLALLREAAAAQELAALSQEARELATQQRALANAHEEQRGARDSTSAAAQQEGLAERGDSLVQQVRQIAKDLRSRSEGGAAEQADSATAQAAAAQDSMAQAARNATARRGERAAEQGRAAAAQLEQAAESLDAARQSASEQREEEATESIQQATRDALALAQQQLELQQQMEQARKGEDGQSGNSGKQDQPKPGNQPGNQDQSGSQRPGRQPTPQPGSQQGGQRPDQGGGQQAGNERGGGQGGQQAGGNAGQPGQGDMSQLRAGQSAVQQGLEQLGRNLSEAGQQTGSVSREVSAALNRAHTSMQETQRALQAAERSEQLPAEQAAQTVDALNRLALSLLQNARQLDSRSGGGLEQARQQLADAAQQQGSINGQGNSLLSLSLSPGAQSDQVRRLGREQQALANRLGGMSDLLGGREDVSGQVDVLAREANALAGELQGGRLTPEIAARQQRLFHRLLDAGRSLEQEETSDERTAERPGNIPPGSPAEIARKLLEAGPRYRPPTPEELRLLPGGYRQLILEYFQRLNRPLPPEPETRR